jgi:branched-chain amino acid transport system permease protein
MMKNKLNDNKKKTIVIALVLLLFILISFAELFLDAYKIRILNLCGINIILALSLNLTNGFTGMFSLGTAGFMSIGAYVTAIMTMPLDVKTMNFFMMPMHPFFEKLQLPFVLALILGGLLAGLVGFLIGAPVLRLKGDYLAIATLGFGEIIAVIFTNLQTITNGSLGLKGIPQSTNLFWSWGIAAFVVILFALMLHSSYGRALKAIREDEIAAQAMGINLFYHKVLAFTLSAFFAGVGGGLMASLISTIDPNMFRFTLTYQIMLYVVLGGLGSITGSILGACIVTVIMELLRSVESTLDLGFVVIPGIPGMRMVIFALMLICVVLFFRNGIMGQKELTWSVLERKGVKNNESSAS